MLWLAIVGAFAAEPDLSGVHVALGADLESATNLPGLAAQSPTLEPAMRLHFGPRLLTEVSFGAGRARETERSEDWEPDEESGDLLSRYDETAIEGWRWTGGLRVAWRVGGDAVQSYVGASGVASGLSAAGPWYEDVPNEDLTALVKGEVGERTETERQYGAAVGWTAVYWASEHLSVSGGLDVPVYGSWRREILETPNGLVPDLRKSVDVDQDEEIGGSPVARLAVHVLL